MERYRRSFKNRGFQTTYEELKLNNYRRKDGTGSFQTTYEELKRLSSIPTGSKRPRFQTTYEELKRFQNRRHPALDSPASRLPMGN